MHKHWAVVLAIGAMMMAATLWTSCGEDEGADTGVGVADTGGGGGGGSDAGGGGTPDSGGGGGGECDGAAIGTECEVGYCVASECLESCDAVGDECADGGCYFVDTGTYVCDSAGSNAVGEECDGSKVGDCEVGAECLDDGSGTDTNVCFVVCAEDADCTDPETCEDTGSGFSACME